MRRLHYGKRDVRALFDRRTGRIFYRTKNDLWDWKGDWADARQAPAFGSGCAIVQ